MRKIIIILSLLITGLNVDAHDFEVDGFYYDITSLTNLTVALTGNGNTYSGNVVVPQNVTWNGRTFVVNEILYDAFMGCTLSSLTVPPSVLYMHLGNATIGKLVIEDGDEQLHCSGRECIRNGHIGEVYLGRNSSLVFWFAGIKKVAFGHNVTEIASSMFEGCDITGTIALPQSIKKIGYGAFKRNANLVEVIATGVERLGSEVFCDCSSLIATNMPNLIIIGSDAFKNCISLTSFEIPQGVATVGPVAFDGCTNLESVIIPNSVVNFGYGSEYATKNQIFRGCSALKSITVNATMPFELEESNFDAQTYINATLHVPSEALDTYKNSNVWKNFFNISGGALSSDNVCSVLIKGCYDLWVGGYVEIGNEKYTDHDAAIAARKGESITLKFIPNMPNPDEYNEYGIINELESVKVNGVDVTRNVVGNELVIEVTGNMTIDISWTETEEAPVFLSIKQADNGNVKLKVSKWDECKVIFEPAEGWKVHSVTFNGTDVTNELSSDNSYRTPEITENSELIVVYVSSTNAVDGIRSEQPSPKVVGSSGCIVISEAEEGQTVYAYTTAGVLVDTAVTHNGTTTIRVQENEVYIVKVGNKTFKVGM